MALHNAFMLSQQCGTWNDAPVPSAKGDHNLQYGLSSIPCFQNLSPRRISSSKASHKTVTFSSLVEFYSVDEIGISDDFVCQPDHFWIDKPRSCAWRKSPVEHVIMHHVPDQRPGAPSPGFQPHYEQIGTPQQEHNFWLQQPEHIQDLALALHEFGGIDDQGESFFIFSLGIYTDKTIVVVDDLG